MGLVRNPSDVVRALETSVVGRTIERLEIFGVNALKTLTPLPSAATGATVVSVGYSEDGRLHLTCEQLAIEVDFARTGGIEVSPSLEAWRAEGRSIPPTGRLLLVDGSGVDFKEPGRTKRITFALHSLPSR